MTTSNSSYYSRQGLWRLFLTCSFPIMFWALLLAFRDISWLTERTNAWDALGTVAYAMVFALAESAVVFIAAALLGFLVSRIWNDRRVALMGVLSLVTSFWAIARQAYILLGISLPAWAVKFLWDTGHPLRAAYLALFPFVLLSVALPTYYILHREKSFKTVQDMLERISLLATFYLFLGVVGLVIVALRNI